MVETPDCELVEVCSRCFERPPSIDTWCERCLFGEEPQEGERWDQDFGGDLP